MPTYTTDAYLLDRLPAGLPDSLDTSGERATFISRGSALAEALVGPRFALADRGGSVQKFPDADDSPPTPEVIVELATACAAAMVMDRIGVDNMDGGSRGAALRAEAEALATRIRGDEVDVVDSAGTRYGDRASELTSTDEDAEPVFSIGRSGADGACLRSGTLDDR